jgi:flagellar biosynthesis GTPase FlhF
MNTSSLTITPAERQLAEDLGLPYEDQLAPAPHNALPKEPISAQTVSAQAASAQTVSAQTVSAQAVSSQPAPAPERSAQAADSRVFKGRSISELIPKIQAELGPEAIVTGRRSGLEGGVGGFFQRPFIEIEAQRGPRGVDVRDGEDARPPVPAEPLAAPAPKAEAVASPDAQAPFVTALAPFQAEGPVAKDAFASALEAAASNGTAAPEQLNGHSHAAAAVSTAPAAPLAPEDADDEGDTTGHDGIARVAPAARSRTETAVAQELQAAGFDEGFSAELLEHAAAHVLPFEPRIGLRRAARVALERRIPRAAHLPTGGAAIALVGAGGAGKSKCITSLSGCYQRNSSRPVHCATIVADGDAAPQLLLAPHIANPVDASSKEARKVLAQVRAEGIALLDTPPLSPADGAAIRALARVLDTLAPERVVVALPATLSASAASRLLRALEPLKPNALAITHTDESDELGVAVHAACAFGLAPEYLLTGSRRERTLTRIDPASLAARLLP